MVLAALLVMLVVNNLTLKKLFARTRPCYTEGIMHFFPGLVEIPKVTSFSFPSGHTTSAFSVAFTIYKQHKKLGIVAIVMAAIMAFTRLYVFVHFPTDIYGGIIVAAGIAYFVYRMEKIITPKIQKLINKKA
jgi:undecaprenyl-diphosphatase